MTTKTDRLEHYDEPTNTIRGYVIEQTITGYGIRIYQRRPWSNLWTQATFIDGFDSRTEARNHLEELTR